MKFTIYIKMEYYIDEFQKNWDESTNLIWKITIFVYSPINQDNIFLINIFFTIPNRRKKMYKKYFTLKTKIPNHCSQLEHPIIYILKTN